MAAQEKFCLRWNDFESNISVAFRELREDKDFFDVTLACEDEQIQAHKVILSACSPFFRTVLKRNPHERPLLYLKGVRYLDIVAVLNFMYHGEVNVAQEDLNTFLSVAEDLQVKGLTQGNGPLRRSKSNNSVEKVDKIDNVPVPKQFKPTNTIQPKPRMQAGQEDDIQEVVPIKSEPMQSQPNDSRIESMQPELNYATSGRGEMVATDDYENDYADYNYETEATYNDTAMMSSAHSDGIDRAMNWSIDGVPWGLNRGLKVNAENNPPIPCPICGKTFKTRGSLATHKYNFHKEGKDNVQMHALMPTMLTDPMQLLDLQMETNSENKEIECPMCHKLFSTKGSLATHKYNYHRNNSTTNNNY